MRSLSLNQTIQHVTGTVATSGDNTLIAAPGSGKQIVISAITIQNESAVATTMIVKFGSVGKWRVLGQNQGDGLAYSFSPEREWEVGVNTALVLNLSGANSCGYSVAYWVDAG